jgi:hypothetical protein
VSAQTLTAIQATATAVSTATAVYLGWLTIRRDRDASAERDRDLQREQLRRVVSSLEALRRVIRDSSALADDFDVARADLAVALALRYVSLPSCGALLHEDVPRPPYNMGQTVAWDLLRAAITEVRRYAQHLRIDTLKDMS